MYNFKFVLTLFQRDDEFDFNATFMIMIPGIDGHYGKFKTLCERLKLSAAVLQPGLDNVYETFPEMARRLVKVTGIVVLLIVIKKKYGAYTRYMSFSR